MTAESTTQPSVSAAPLEAEPELMSRTPSIEARLRRVAESLNVAHPGNHAGRLPEQADPRVECHIELDIDLIDPYAANPRRMANPRYDEIKASIREIGMSNPLTVTRRPDERHYVLEAGGNTRLQAVRELWEETRDPRFQRLVVLFRPWRSERHVLSAHLIENELRGELSFWDKACGMHALKRSFEDEYGVEMSLRELALELRGLGLTVTHGTLSHWLFGAQRLRTLGESIPALSGLDVRRLQPRLNALKRYARSRCAMPEDIMYERFLEPEFGAAVVRYAACGQFDVDSLYAACEAALAAHTGDSVEVLREIVDCIEGESRVENGDTGPRVVAPQSSGRSAPLIDADRDSRPAEDASVAPLTATRRNDVSRVAGDERLNRLVQAFAAAAGIAHRVAPVGGTSSGLRLERLSQNEATDPAHGRAWCLLAGLLGETDTPSPPVALDASFAAWLTDAQDPAANACWDLLCAARESRDGPR